MNRTQKASRRVLMIAPTGFFADYGCHVRIAGQARALQARGHDVVIVTYPGGRNVPGLPAVRPPWPSGGREMPVGSSSLKFLLDFCLAPVLWRTALQFRPHVLHAYLHEGALLAAPLAQFLRIPLVFDFQGSLVSEMLDHHFLSPQSVFLPAWRRLERWIDAQPRMILASSQHAAQLLTSNFGVPSERVRTLPDSVDVQQFQLASSFSPQTLHGLRQRLNLPENRPLVVYLGLLASYQGIDLLLESARLLTSDTRLEPRPFFLIMGFPHVEHYRSRAETLGLQNDVQFLGAVPFLEAPLHLALGDVAVAPKISATEGSGKLLTYMASGLPVVAFDTPVNREYLADFGVYATLGSAVSLADALARVLADSGHFQRVGHELRTRAETFFTWEHAAKIVESAYDAVIS